MSSNINLISPKKEARYSRYYKGIQFMRLTAISLLFGVAASSIILFTLIALSPLPQLEIQEQNERAVLAQSHTEMAKIQVIHDRTALIDSVLKNRTDYAKVISSLRAKMPPGLTLITYTINGKDASLTVSSKSLSSIESFLSNLTSSAGRGKEYSKVILTNIVQDNEKGAYVTSVQITLL